MAVDVIVKSVDFTYSVCVCVFMCLYARVEICTDDDDVIPLYVIILMLMSRCNSLDVNQDWYLQRSTDLQTSVRVVFSVKTR